MTQLSDEVVEALEAAREALSLGAAMPLPDPRCSDEVRQLCDRHGYGAVMSTASLLWRQTLGDLEGSEFCAGPCRSTAESAISKIDEVLTEAKGDIPVVEG